MSVRAQLLAFIVFSGMVLAPGFRSTCQQDASPNQLEILAHFRAGQDEMQASRFDRAVEQFKLVLGLRPDLVEARVDLGLAYHALGDYGLAVAELKQAAHQKPDLLAANLFLGLSYIKLESPEKAILYLERALALDPSNRDARRSLATAELSEGNYGKSATLFRKLGSAEPDQADAWFMLGHDYLQMAKSLTSQMSLQFHDSAWALRLAGDILGERRLYNDAAIAYRQALRADPAQPGLHAALAGMYLRTGKNKEADAEFKAELSHNPFEPAALLGRAQVYLLDGRPQKALDQIATIWKKSPDTLVQAAGDFPEVELAADTANMMAGELDLLEASPAREFILSALYRIGGDADRAGEERAKFVESATRLAASGPNPGPLSGSVCENHSERACVSFLSSRKRLDPNDQLRLGQALFALHRDEDASNTFADALQKNKKSAEAMYWLSLSYLRMAAACFNHLATAYPDSWRTHEVKAEALHLRQADKDAIVEYHIAESQHPEDPKIHEALGELLLSAKLLDEAKTELEAALRLNPAAARSLYLLGRLYVDQREPAKAVPFLEAALHYDPSLLEARPVLGKAYLKIGKPDLAARQLEMSSPIDRYGNFHYLLYQAYRDAGKPELAARALARSQELRHKSEIDDQARIPVLGEEK